jgi:O-antigen/teichoic acid export membrane protein
MLGTQIRTLARHAAIYGSADVFGNVINFLLLPIITRHLSTSDYGALGILLLFGVMTKILFRMGLDSGFFRIYYEQETDRDRRTFTTTIFIAAATVSLSLFALTIAASQPISRLLLGTGRHYIILVAADTFLNAFAFVPMNLFRIQERSTYFTSVSIFRNALNAGLKVLLVVAGWGVAGVLWSDVLSSAVFVLVLSPALVKSLGTGFSWTMLREALSFGLPKVPHSVAYQVLNLSDRKLLDLLSTRAEVGLYHVAYQFGTGVKFFLSAFELAWSPFVYSLLKRGDAPQTLARIATYAAIVLFAIGLAIAVLARELLMLMTAPEFHSGYPVIPVIVLAHVFQGLFILTSIGIGISKKSYYYPVITISAAAVNVSTNLILIPQLGKMGAAWATVAGYGLMTAMGIYFSNRHYPIPFEWRRIGSIALAAASSYGLSLAAPEYVWTALPVKILALCLFPAALYFFGFFRPEEIARIKRLISTGGGSGPPPPPDPLG